MRYRVQVHSFFEFEYDGDIYDLEDGIDDLLYERLDWHIREVNDNMEIGDARPVREKQTEAPDEE